MFRAGLRSSSSGGLNTLLRVRKTVPPYAFFNKVAYIEDRTVQEADTLQDRNKVISAHWRNLSEKARAQFAAEASKTRVASFVDGGSGSGSRGREGKKKQRLTLRQKYFRENYKRVLNLPFHRRLAKLHKMYEEEANNRTAGGSSSASTKLLNELGRRSKQGSSKEEAAAYAKRIESLRLMYRKAVSSSVSPRGPPPFS